MKLELTLRVVDGDKELAEVERDYGIEMDFEKDEERGTFVVLYGPDDLGDALESVMKYAEEHVNQNPELWPSHDEDESDKFRE